MMNRLRFLLGMLFLFSTPAAFAIGAAGNTEWPEGAALKVQLKLTAALDKDGTPKVAGDMIVTNPTDKKLTIQVPTNRLVLAFAVFDGLGNPVAAEGLAKVDPGFDTVSLAPGATYTYRLEGLDFLTGSIQRGFVLKRGESYRVVAIYRAAGPGGPGFASDEAKVEIPK